MNGPLESGPNDDGELIEEPNEALNGECEAPEACCCEGPDMEPNGNDGEIENVDPPKLKDGADWLGKRFCCPCWLAALNWSYGDDCGAGWFAC